MKKDVNPNSNLWNKYVEFNSATSYVLESSSGLGKSSFISFCYGLRNDFYGEILIDKQNIKNFSSNNWSEIRTHKLSIIPQNLKLFNNLSILDNLNIKNNLTNYKSISEILEFMKILQIDALKDKMVAKLSLGQKQRVAIIRALLQPFEFIFLDEPFSHLDKQNTYNAMGLIQEQCEKQKSSFMITSLGNEKIIFNNTTKIIL